MQLWYFRQYVRFLIVSPYFSALYCVLKTLANTRIQIYVRLKYYVYCGNIKVTRCYILYQLIYSTSTSLFKPCTDSVDCDLHVM